MKVIPADYLGTRIPVKTWLSEDPDHATLTQVTNLARLPFAMSHVALMPDAHAGYSMPIGAVLMTDLAVIPNAVGVDIACGVQLLRTDLHWGETFHAADLAKLLAHVQRTVPTGFAGHEKPPLPMSDLMTLLQMDVATDEAIPAAALGRAALQLGTLGGGNHFLECQMDEADDGRVYFMLHSGSRSLGKKICDHYHAIAQRLNARWHTPLPEPGLAFLPWETPEAKAYWAAMEAATRFAHLSRDLMMKRAADGFADLGSSAMERVVDINHNYAAWENHGGRNGIVHRKGAVRARLGETVLIPGSMGTASFVGEGRGCADSFQSCQHGAGRAFGRKEITRKLAGDVDLTGLTTAKEKWNVTAAAASKATFEEMASLGIQFLSGEPESAAEESPAAYKDVRAVMAASRDLVWPTIELSPLGVVKG